MKPPRSSHRKVCSQTAKPATSLQEHDDNPPNSSLLIQSVEDFFEGNPKIRKILDSFNSGKESVEGLAEHFHKISRRDHHVALSVAYCIWLKSGKNDAFRKFAYEAEISRKKIDKRVTKLRVILEKVISYGDDTARGLRQAQKMYSRDEAAIRYLAHQGIGPGEIKSEVNKEKAGLDKWSRLWPKIRKVELNKKLEIDGKKTNFSNDILQDLQSFEWDYIFVTLRYGKKGCPAEKKEYNIAPSAESDQLLLHLGPILKRIQQISQSKPTSDDD
ncbi:hypothetical protein MKK75_21130 [Methylobacterium sp. J-030]|uniref:hypothetical protein n=1 Tax=Methylobacterium sp. J-030 TaxID=2836627 RepID=UPI001FB9294C|nr:hypothetical protein [Methylobacterium sp. J-030]MCJ2071264.1 hypothetical protein [Methylobacterium sp. J-030]